MTVEEYQKIKENEPDEIDSVEEGSYDEYDDDDEELDEEDSDEEDYEEDDDEDEELDDEEGDEEDDQESISVKGSRTVQKARVSRAPEVNQEVVAEAARLAKFVNENQVIKDFLYYQSQGYKDEDIIKGMSMLIAEKQKVEEDPVFGSWEEEMAWKVKKATEKEMAPIKAKLDAYEKEKHLANIQKNNNKTLSSALASNGWNPNITGDQASKITKVLTKLYPGVDLNLVPMDEEQFDIVVTRALGRNTKSRKKTTSIKSEIKQASAPRVLSGKAPKSYDRERGDVAQKGALTRSERNRNIDKLLGF